LQDHDPKPLLRCEVIHSQPRLAPLFKPNLGVNVNQTKLKKSLSGIALLVGLAAGSALAMVPSFTPESAAPLRRQCSISCADCNTNADCGGGGGICSTRTCYSQ
jgi:hypothetical protein